MVHKEWCKVSNDLYDCRWEKCMFGWVIHTSNYTIRVWKKEKRVQKGVQK